VRITLLFVVLLLAACGGGSDAGVTQKDVAQQPSQSPVYLASDLARQVREMADDNNVPVSGSPLEAMMISHGHSTATCVDYSTTLIKLIGDNNIPVQARPARGSLNDWDAHELVEIYNPDRDTWELLDPTFGLIPHNADGTVASFDDVHKATRAKHWSAITYEYITDRNDDYARNYYVDWPLLFVNNLNADDPVDDDIVSEYYLPADSSNPHYSIYALHCPAGAATAEAMFDTLDLVLDCYAGPNVTQSLGSHTVTPLDSSVGLELQRFVFTWQ
jgi:hypothetical protein